LEVSETFASDNPSRMDVQGQEKRGDVENERYWRRVIGEPARSGVSVRRFRRARTLRKSQFCWWHRRLKEWEEARTLGNVSGADGRKDGIQPTFALVSDESRALGAPGIELAFGDGRPASGGVGKGVDEETPRTVDGVRKEGCRAFLLPAVAAGWSKLSWERAL
jgi:hypothetical protein